MTENTTVLNQITNTEQIPAEEAVKALLEAEKLAKKEKAKYSLQNLLGTWNLRFITGTKKTRKKAGVILGEGKYLPKFLKITLTYEKDSTESRGKVFNCIDLQFLKLTVSGPVNFLAKQNIMAFDFTQIEVKLANFTIFKGYLGSGQKREESFYTAGIQKQAFFVYFLIQPQLIAARGRGGGLAIWTREEEQVKN